MKIVFNPEGFQALLQHPDIQEDLVRRGQAVAAAADKSLGDARGDGYEVREPTQFPNRDRVAIVTASNQARADNARNMTLIKSLGAAR